MLLGDWSRAERLAEKPGTSAAAEFLRTRLLSRLSLWRKILGGVPFDPRFVVEPRAGQPVSSEGVVGAALRGAIEESDERVFEEQVARLRGVRLERTLLQIYAECLSAVGRATDAVDAVARAVDAGLEDLAWMRHAPPCAGLRADSRWRDLEARVADRAKPILAAWYEREA